MSSCCCIRGVVGGVVRPYCVIGRELRGGVGSADVRAGGVAYLIFKASESGVKRGLYFSKDAENGFRGGGRMRGFSRQSGRGQKIREGGGLRQLREVRDVLMG